MDSFQTKLASVNLNDEQSIVNLLTAWDKTIPSSPANDVLDGRRLCGDVDANGKTLDGSSCVTILQQCLTTDSNDCIKKFNTLQWDQQINVDTMDYYVARNLAKHLGFYDQPVLDAVKAVTLTTGKALNDNVILLFNAIKEKINKVEKIKNKWDIIIPTEKVPTMMKRIPRIVIDGMVGGGITSYNDLIINLDTIKVNLTMNGGGSDTSILVKTSLTQLIQLLEKEGKKIDDKDLGRIHQYISSLERSENKLKKVRDYINILIKAILENGYDIKNDKNVPNVTLDFLQKFAEKESELLNITNLKVHNLIGAFQIVLDVSRVKPN